MNLNPKIKQQIDRFHAIKNNYPHIAKAGTPIEYPAAPIMGRDTTELREALRNPEKANVILLGDPGVGKTAFMQGFTYDDASTSYLVISVNVERIIDNQGDKDAELANGLQNLVSEVSDYCKQNNVIMILFIDEFHRIPMLSPTAVEALKPILEKSAYNGFRIVAATTFEEYDQWIAPNRALDQRLLRMTMTELPREAVIKILKSRAKQYEVSDLAEPDIYDTIYDTSKEILLSNSQPRASIDIFNSLIGTITKEEYMKDGKLVRVYATPKDLGIPGDKIVSRHTLNKVIQRAYGIDIDNKVKVKDIRQALTDRIFDQDFAINKVVSRLEMILAGFNDPTRPRGSLLFTGPTGSGKSCSNDTPVPTPTGWKKHGDLKVGDVVFTRLGKPTTVTAVYPHKSLVMYRVTLNDGRHVDVCENHLWKVYTQKQTRNIKYGKSSNGYVMSTKDLLQKDLSKNRNGHIELQYYLPRNQEVEYEQITSYDPYVVGAFIGDGSLTIKALTLATVDEHIYTTIAQKLNATVKSYRPNGHVFHKVPGVCIQTKDVLPNELCGLKSIERYIPDNLKQITIEQRYELLQGLFDTDGSVQKNGTVTYSTHNRQLMNDVAEVLYSLGYRVTKHTRPRTNKNTEYVLTVMAEPERLRKLFSLPRKLERIHKNGRVRTKSYDFIGIKSITRLPAQDAQCITVDDPEHLYLVGDYIVTHNTEVTKVVAETMGIPLKRFDMSRYSRDEDAVRFADDLAQAAWSAPNGLILIDEIEKSSRPAINNLLQVLDDARLTAANNPNRVISFTGNIIFITTNLASEIYQHMKQFDGKDGNIDTELVYNALAEDDRFETAVLGRLDDIVPFLGLPESAMMNIAHRDLVQNLRIIESDKRRVLVSDDIIPYIVKDRTSQDTERGGARDAKRNVKAIVLQEVAHYLANEPNEVPIILHLVGEARFKYEYNSDPLSASVALTECHPQELVDSWMGQLRAKLKMNLVDEGIFVPNTWDSKEFALQIVTGTKRGIRRFKTHVDDDRIWIDEA